MLLIGIWVCKRVLMMTVYWLQLCSSDMSLQSLYPLQTWCAGIQRPSLHWNWSSRHAAQPHWKYSSTDHIVNFRRFITAGWRQLGFVVRQESRAVARELRDATTAFGLKFADNIHYNFKSSQASKARLQSSKRTGAKQNLTQNGPSTKDSQFFGGFQILCGSHSANLRPTSLLVYSLQYQRQPDW